LASIRLRDKPNSFVWPGNKIERDYKVNLGYLAALKNGGKRSLGLEAYLEALITLKNS